MDQQDFHRAIDAAQRGDRETARYLLRQVLVREPNHIRAWIWMSGLLDDVAQQKECLERALAIDPNNQAAREGLNVLRLREFITSLPQPIQADSQVEPRRIGAYLVDHSYITKEQLEAALLEQHQRKSDGVEHVMVGDILVQHGWLSARVLATALIAQQEERRAAQAHMLNKGAQRLGEYLVRERLITAAQLADLLAEQTRSRHAGEPILLGELLVSNGYITPRELEHALELQFKDFFSE